MDVCSKIGVLKKEEKKHVVAIVLCFVGSSSSFLQQCTFTLWFVRDNWTQHGSNRLVKHRLEALLRQRWALQILDGADLFGHGQALKR